MSQATWQAVLDLLPIVLSDRRCPPSQRCLDQMLRDCIWNQHFHNDVAALFYNLAIRFCKSLFSTKILKKLNLVLWQGNVTQLLSTKISRLQKTRIIFPIHRFRAIF